MDSNIVLEGSGFLPEEFEDVKMCLEMICSIRARSQPLNRELGIDYDSVIDYPLNVAKNMLALEIIEKVNTYEPRVEVHSVDFETGVDGQMIPHIHFIKKERK